MRFITLLFMLVCCCGLTAQIPADEVSWEGLTNTPTVHDNDDYGILDCTGGGCVVNAGQDQVICTDGSLVLAGESNPDFATPLVAVWAAAPGNPAPLTLEQPNALITEVAFEGTDFPPGLYTFSLTVTCADGSLSCDEVQVTIVELPDIQLVVPEVPVCANEVFVPRSEPLPEGVTESLVLRFSGQFNVEEVEGGFLISRTDRGDCPVEFVYTIFAGTSCRTDQTGMFNLSGPSNENELRASNIQCSDDRLTGRLLVINQNAQCSNLTVTAVSMPEGVQQSDIIISDLYLFLRFDFSAPAGDYVFEVTLENECGTETASVAVSCPEVEECSRIPSSSTSLTRVFCGRLGDVPSLIELGVPEFSDATYQWIPQSIPDWATYELFPNGATATLLLTGEQPADNYDVSISFRVFVYDELNPDCPPASYYSSVRVPIPIVAEEEQVNINCGAGSTYVLSDNISFGFALRFNVLSFPPGYSGPTSGSTSGSSGILQLSQFGSYYIQLSRTGFRRDFVTGESVLCTTVESFTIVVDDIPNIDAGSDAVVCEEMVQLNGSTPRNAAGVEVDINILWEPVEDYPGVSISDPTIRDPLVSGMQPGQSYTFRYSFPGDPNCEKEDLVTITVDDDCPAEPDPLDCELTLESRCGTCGCGEPVFFVYAYDSNGDRMDGDRFHIEWFVGEDEHTSSNPDGYIVKHYTGPVAVTAVVTFELPNGTKCVVEERIAVTCGKDCPVVEFEYDAEDCDEEGGFYGDVTIVDQAGHLLYGAGVDWYIDGDYDGNPTTIYAPPGDAIPVFLNFFSPTQCQQTLKFIPDCSTDNGRQLEDLAGAKRAPESSAPGIAPNPAGRDRPLVVSFGSLQPRNLNVIDLNGRTLFRTDIKAGEPNYSLSPSGLPAGVLLVVLRDENGRVISSQRLVVR